MFTGYAVLYVVFVRAYMWGIVIERIKFFDFPRIYAFVLFEKSCEPAMGGISYRFCNVSYLKFGC